MSIPRPVLPLSYEDSQPEAGALEHRFAKLVARKYRDYIGRWDLDWEGVPDGTVKSFAVKQTNDRLYITVVLV